MKRIFSFLLATVLAVSMFTGCQKTPASLATTDNNLKQPIEAAQNSGIDSGMHEQLNLPDRFTGEWTGLDGSFHVSADADITLPDIDVIPTAKVTRKQFSQEDADRILDYFIKDNMLYKDLGLNNQEAQELLEKYYAVQRGELRISEVTTDHTIEELPEIIARWEKYLKTAPENSEVQSSRKFQPHAIFDEEITGYAYVDDKTVYVNISNDADGENLASIYISGYGTSNICNYQYVDELQMDVDVQMSEVQALQQGDALLKDLGIQNFICNQSRTIYYNTENETGYELEYVRTVNGFPITHNDFYCYTADGSMITIPAFDGSASSENEFDNNSSWAYERITVCVSKNGIVYFRWCNPYSEPLIQMENAQLMNFQDVSDIFAKMIFVKNHYWQENNERNGYICNHNVEVDNVCLNLMRIRNKNSYSEGTLVPVWDFWAKTTSYPEDEQYRDIVFDGSYYEIVLTINALDGTIIDRELGY